MSAARRAARLLAPLAWTALIAWFSSESWSATGTRSALLPWFQALLPLAPPETIEALHVLVRKAAHVTEYGVLAGLWTWATGRWRPALALSVVTAFLDEAHQATTIEREGSVADLLLDSTGAGAGLWLLHRGTALALQDMTLGLLWTAAAGGSALLVLDVAAGAPAGWLWLSAPAAWLALGLRLRVGRRP